MNDGNDIKSTNLKIGFRESSMFKKEENTTELSGTIRSHPKTRTQVQMIINCFG